MDGARSLGEQMGEVDAFSVWSDQIWALGPVRGQYSGGAD